MVEEGFSIEAGEDVSGPHNAEEEVCRKQLGSNEEKFKDAVPCPLCSIEASSNEKLRTHLIQEHKIQEDRQKIFLKVMKSVTVTKSKAYWSAGEINLNKRKSSVLDADKEVMFVIINYLPKLIILLQNRSRRRPRCMKSGSRRRRAAQPGK